jgi:transposase InsO family protein
MLREDLFIDLIDTELQQKISDCQDLDRDTADAVKLLLNDGPSELRNDLADWTIKETDGKKLIFYKNRNYIPANDELRREIVQRYHDAMTAGHPGELQTFNAVAQHYWWPGLRTFIKNYVRGCGVCQQFKINRRPSKPALVPIPASKSLRPFAQIAADFITDLPVSKGYDSILSVVDHGHTKGVILIPCNKTITAEETAQLLIDHVYKRFGIPEKMISDRGPQFAAQVFREILKALEIESSLSTAYHPQTDGTTERFNQEIETWLSIYCLAFPETWAEHLAILEFTHNNRRHADRPYTPFELMLGINPRTMPTTFDSEYHPSIEDRMKHLEKIRHEALAAHELARQRMTARIKSTFKPFSMGQRVWLESKNLNLGYNKKIKAKREGPFEITEVLGPTSYRIKIPEHWKQVRVHDVFHATLLTPYVETETHGPNFTRPSPEIDTEDTFEVERILKHKKRQSDGQYLYRILWKGYPISEATWEEEKDLTGAMTILNQYKTTHIKEKKTPQTRKEPVKKANKKQTRKRT